MHNTLHWWIADKVRSSRHRLQLSKRRFVMLLVSVGNITKADGETVVGAAANEHKVKRKCELHAKTTIPIINTIPLLDRFCFCSYIITLEMCVALNVDRRHLWVPEAMAHSIGIVMCYAPRAQTPAATSAAADQAERCKISNILSTTGCCKDACSMAPISSCLGFVPFQ